METHGGADAKKRLKVLAADEDQKALEGIAAILEELGHDVTSFAVGVSEAADRIIGDEPDLAVVVLHDDDGHALDLIEEITEYASGPVIALLESEDPEFVQAAAKRGIYAYARPINPSTVQSAIEIAVRRHSEISTLTEQVDRLENALERRAIIERAKGILMERHSLGDRAAFEMLRTHARSHQRSVVELSRSVTEGHALLPPQR